MSLRQKILACYAAIFLLFLVLLFPLGTEVVKIIVTKTMRDRVEELTEKIKQAPNNELLIRYLKDQKPSIFFRVGLITDQKKILYDSQIKRLLATEFSQEYVVSHPEVDEAFEKGIGYKEADSKLLGMRFVYLAKAFDFHGKTYILRAAFPYKNVEALNRDFRFGFLALGSTLLILFGSLTWFVVQRLTHPIQQIIEAVKPYQEDKEDTLPTLVLKTGEKDIDKLASTLNALSEKVRKQIKALVFEKNEKEALLASLEEGVIAQNESGEITYCNPAAAWLLEKDVSSLIGSFAGEVLPHKWYELATLTAQKKETVKETLAFTIFGKTKYLDLICIALKEEKGVILVIQDRTKSHLLSEMRKDFVANASHELKTPLTIIQGFSETIYDNPDLPESTKAEILGKVVKNCKRMSGLIKDLLKLADLENSDEKAWEPCDFLALVNKCKSLCLEAYPQASIQINTDGDTQALCLPSLMEQAITNLLENGAKYSSTSPKLSVNIKKTKEEMIITVSDSGIGIPKESLPSIFNRFYTVNKAHSKKLGGSGLGLSIVRQIIEKHKGRITVDSEIGKGSTFTLSIPLIFN